MSINNLNLEIYEYILNKYTTDSSLKYGINTNKIESIPDDQCGYISMSDDSYNKVPIDDDELIRSCDIIDGTLNNLTLNVSSASKPIIKDTENNIKFTLGSITSNDLILFSHQFASKVENRNMGKFKKISSMIPNMQILYNDATATDIIKKVSVILQNDWPAGLPAIKPTTHTYIKMLKPKSTDKIIIIGDIHGSFGTFIRILLRFRKMKVFDENCIFDSNYHLIFLGDIVDRGVYGYEIIMLIFMLKQLNPRNVHINNGNHEEAAQNMHDGLKDQIEDQFKDLKIYELINRTFNKNHSALLIANPIIVGKYIYLAHGGLPINNPIALDPNIDNLTTKTSIFITNKDIEDTGGTNTIRWNDFYGKNQSIINPERGDPSGTAYIIGLDLITQAKSKGIDLIIRAHQDDVYNTKLIIKGASYDNFTNINDINPSTKNKVCYGNSHLIKLDGDDLNIDGKKYPTYLPVITISTNTDKGRHLARDSFTILKFIE
jgi:hypothetical protein